MSFSGPCVALSHDHTHRQKGIAEGHEILYSFTTVASRSDATTAAFPSLWTLSLPFPCFPSLPFRHSPHLVRLDFRFFTHPLNY
ncbi:hypothetical protein M758_UG016900 [Ceratodon purpureus]|nr:hypothetical protein M758_UG016900 [Ceratodon purpureus]